MVGVYIAVACVGLGLAAFFVDNLPMELHEKKIMTKKEVVWHLKLFEYLRKSLMYKIFALLALLLLSH